MNSVNEFCSRLSLPTLVLLLLASLVTACGQKDEQKQALERREYTPSNRIWTENQGIGADWFDLMFGRQSTVTPKAKVFAVEDAGGDVTYLRFTSYTSDNDDWGYVSFYVADNNGAPSYMESKTSLYDAPECVQLRPAKFVPCDSENADLYLSGNRRFFLDFQVNFVPPTVYTIPKAGRSVYAIDAQSIEELDRTGLSWKKGLMPLPDAYANHEQSRIARAVEGNVELSVNSDGVVAAWKMLRDANHNITGIDTLCGTIQDDANPLKNGVTGSIDLTFLMNEEGSAGKVYGVDLCKGEVAELVKGSTPWERARNGEFEPLSYDLILYTEPDGKIEPILGPKSISWDYGIYRDINTLEEARRLTLDKEIIHYANYI